MASLTEEEVALEAAPQVAGVMSWGSYKATLREKFKLFLVSHCWPEREFEVNAQGEYLIPSVEHMYQGYVVAHQELHGQKVYLER